MKLMETVTVRLKLMAELESVPLIDLKFIATWILAVSSVALVTLSVRQITAVAVMLAVVQCIALVA